MYLDFEDYRPEFYPVGRAISLREGVLIAFIVHLLAVIFLLISPRLFPDEGRAARAQALVLKQQQRADQPRFVFVQPRLDLTAPEPPERAEPSDKDRVLRSPESAKQPTNPLPFRAATHRNASKPISVRRRVGRGRRRLPRRASRRRTQCPPIKSRMRSQRCRCRNLLRRTTGTGTPWPAVRL